MKKKPVEIYFKSLTHQVDDRHYFISDEFRMFLFEIDCRRLLQGLVNQFEARNTSGVMVLTWEDMFEILQAGLMYSTTYFDELVITRKSKKVSVFFRNDEMETV